VPSKAKVILATCGVNLDKGQQSLLFLDLHAFAVQYIQYISAVNPPKIAFLKKRSKRVNLNEAVN
jgi:hypothetical protein